MAAPVMDRKATLQQKAWNRYESVMRVVMLVVYGFLSAVCMAAAVQPYPSTHGTDSRLTVLEQRVAAIEHSAERIRAEERLARLEETTRLTLALLDRANTLITMLAVGMAVMLVEAFIRNAVLLRNGRKREN